MLTVNVLMHVYMEDVLSHIFCCLPTGYIQASRALMIASIVFGTFGLVATLTGMQCSKIGGENYVLKGRIAAIGGVFFLLQGKDLEVDVMGMFKKNALENVQKVRCVCEERSLQSLEGPALTFRKCPVPRRS